VAVLLEAAEGRFSLEVLDDGPGVPPDDIARLSERAFRGDQARSRDLHGEGLGLAITAELCARAGFELRFDAEAPRGLRVSITGTLVTA
jgi:signal transduction histidine kinase